jgi:serine/threonine-protein kinase
LIFVGGPSAAVAGILAFLVFPFNPESEPDVNNIVASSTYSAPLEYIYGPETKPVRSSLILGQTRSRRIGMRTELGLSNDGSRLVFNSYGESGGININILELDSLDPILVQDVNLSYDLGYCNCGGPSFSPDGEWILYVENSLLHRVRSEGSAPQEISDIESTFGAHWVDGNTILYTNFRDGKLYRMTSAGRSPELVQGQIDLGLVHSFPYQINSDGALIYTIHPNESVSLGNIYLLDPAIGQSTLLIEDAFNAKYATSGHIVFVRDGSIWAVPFDESSLKIVGEEVPVITGVETWADRGISNYDFSDYGRLVYLPGEQLTPGAARVSESNLVWINKDGTEEPIDLRPQSFSFPQISPDGNFLALTITEEGRPNSDIWVYDFLRKTLGKRTFTGVASRAIWSRDGTHLFFRTVDASGIPNGIWSIPTSGTGSPELLVQEAVLPLTTSPDDLTLLFERGVGIERNVYAFSEAEEISLDPIFSNSRDITNSKISPDGKWISYVSVETGINQVYIHPYPEVDSGRWQVSINGGNEPVWRSDGKSIYFIGSEDQLLRVTNLSDSDSQFSASFPEIVVELDDVQINRTRNYDVHPFDEKFLFLRDPGTVGLLNADVVSLVMVENWFEELKRLVPIETSFD